MDWVKPFADLYARWGWLGVIAGLIVIQWFLPQIIRLVKGGDFVSYKDIKGLKEKLDTLDLDFKKHLEKEAEEDIKMAKFEMKLMSQGEKLDEHKAETLRLIARFELDMNSAFGLISEIKTHLMK